MEAVFGTSLRTDALKDMLNRMETGRNRGVMGKKKNKLVNEFQDWINGSVAPIMFLNTRSAVLQRYLICNFVNWSDNNMLAALKLLLINLNFGKTLACL